MQSILRLFQNEKCGSHKNAIYTQMQNLGKHHLCAQGFYFLFLVLLSHVKHGLAIELLGLSNHSQFYKLLSKLMDSYSEVCLINGHYCMALFTCRQTDEKLLQIFWSLRWEFSRKNHDLIDFQKALIWIPVSSFHTCMVLNKSFIMPDYQVSLLSHKSNHV